MPPLPPEYRSKVESRHFAHLWIVQVAQAAIEQPACCRTDKWDAAQADIGQTPQDVAQNAVEQKCPEAAKAIVDTDTSSWVSTDTLNTPLLQSLGVKDDLYLSIFFAKCCTKYWKLNWSSI